MADEIVIGAEVINRASYFNENNTSVLLGYPSNGTGVLHTLEFWLVTNASGIKIGTFYGSVASLTSRDFVAIGPYSGGYKITVVGVEVDNVEGDFIGSYGARMEGYSAGGYGASYVSGDKFGISYSPYTYDYNAVFSLRGIGSLPVTGEGGGILVGSILYSDILRGRILRG